MNDDAPQPPAGNDPAAAAAAGASADAHELIMAAVEERLSPGQAARLERLVCDDPAVRRLYAIFVHQRSVISMMASPAEGPADLESGEPVGAPSMHDTMVLRAIASAPPDDSGPMVRPPPHYPPPPSEPEPMTLGRIFRAPSVMTAAVAAVLLLLAGTVLLIARRASSTVPAVVAVRPAPAQPAATPPAAQPVRVARVTRSVAAEWKRSSPPAATDGGVEADAPLQLTAGYAELTFARGATMVVEAPATFTVRSDNAVSLASGKIAATVPPAARGFAVTTGESTITDLGTEFGVRADPRGLTEVDVFKGRVVARAAMAAATAPPVTLAQGKAATITPLALQLDPRGASPQKFVRQLQTDAAALDAVDLVAGGDGTAGRRGAAIDQTNGDYGRFPHRVNVTGDGSYYPVLALTVVDGCFVPNGTTPVDSAAHRFAFPVSWSQSYDYIRAGGPMNWPHVPGLAVFSGVLGGVDYDAPGHGMLFMHCNGGLTFDLAALRRLCPAKRVAAFRAVVGNPATRDDAGKDVTVTSNAWVLVDGVPRFSRTFTNKEGAIAIDVPLTPGDRFLTLATAVPAGKRVTLNWTIFGDPRFALADR